MKNISISFAVIIVVLAFFAAGCDTGAGGDRPGTVSFEIVNAQDAFAGGANAEIHVFPHGSDANDPANCVAAQFVPVASETVTTTMMVDDGAYSPTTEEWVGEPGWGRYDIYMLFDFDGDHYITEGIGEKTNAYPSQLYIDNNRVITLDYETDLVER